VQLAPLYDGELPELREDIFKLSKHNSSYYSPFLAVASIVCGRRKLFLTSHGHIGLGPETMSKGEIVCVLGGATMPHFLKKVGGYFLLVEDCFVDNLMDGEAVIAMRKSEAHLGPILTGNLLKGKPPTQMSDTGKDLVGWNDTLSAPLRVLSRRTPVLKDSLANRVCRDMILLLQLPWRGLSN
jgi:hypothetical protein